MDDSVICLEIFILLFSYVVLGYWVIFLKMSLETCKLVKGICFALFAACIGFRLYFLSSALFVVESVLAKINRQAHIELKAENNILLTFHLFASTDSNLYDLFVCFWFLINKLQ